MIATAWGPLGGRLASAQQPLNWTPTAPGAPVQAGVPTAAAGGSIQLTVNPTRIVAAVGTQILVVAGVSRTGQPFAGQRIDWKIKAGVGQLVATPNGQAPPPMLPGQRPAGDPSHAIGHSSAIRMILNRGSVNLADDVIIQPGQTWIGVTSSTEGVTTLAVTLAGSTGPGETVTIDWIDAKWSLPTALASAVGGRQVLTTTLTRRTANTPLVGWKVKYEIDSGTPAEFVPNGRVAEVLTDDQGRAAVEIGQQTPSAGKTRVTVQVIRPAGVKDRTSELIIGSGTIEKPWTAATNVAGPSLSVRLSGPTEAAVGALIAYRVEVSNPTPQPAENVVVSNQLDPGVKVVGSTPAARLVGRVYQWSLGQVGPRQTRFVDLQVRIDAPARFHHCVSARAAEGQAAQSCMDTFVKGSAGVELRVNGPESAQVGESVTYSIEISNPGGAATPPLLLTDIFDEGLQHPASTSTLENDIKPIAPGETRTIRLTFKAIKTGRWCHTVKVSGNGVNTSAQKCVVVASAPVSPLPSTFSVRKLANKIQVETGDVVEFKTEVTNTGRGLIPELTVTDRYDAALQPERGNAGSVRVEDRTIWTIRNIEPGEVVPIIVECRGKVATARACSRVVVSNGAGMTQTSEACVQIVAPVAGAPAPLGGGLTLRVADRGDPIKISKQTSYVVSITNNGQFAEKEVALQVAIPPEMEFVRATGPVGNRSTATTVQFGPVAGLAPGDFLTYEIVVNARRAGDARLRAEVSSRSLSRPLIAEESTRIVE